MSIEVFKRTEQKYLLNKEQFDELLKRANKHFIKDEYYYCKINNIYFDTIDNYLIINSIEKPIYKEKVRLRYYGILTDKTPLFLEIKKKYKGIVYKRRVVLDIKQYHDYINHKIIPKTNNDQIMKEINYTFNYYNLIPKMFISYERFSYKLDTDKSFRLTFDSNIKYRTDNLSIDNDNGDILMNDKYIMEIKLNTGIPLWFNKILTDLKIYPNSYSKYGEAYKRRNVNV